MSAQAIQKNKRWTYDDYINLPDDHNIYEIIEGNLYMTPAPTPKHQNVSLNLAFLIKRYLKEHLIGKIYESPIDVLLGQQTVVQPDVLFILTENLSIITDKNIQGAPDLVIEIYSPGTIQKDRILKVKSYAKFGVKHLWLIDPDNQTLEAFELDKETYRLVECLAGEEVFYPSIFPGLNIPLKELWE